MYGFFSFVVELPPSGLIFPSTNFYGFSIFPFNNIPLLACYIAFSLLFGVLASYGVT